ncbi:hypothetical protein MMC13_007805 [Lambiella insularis]|nr:hypothetical protein [Lambiella insularis]
MEKARIQAEGNIQELEALRKTEHTAVADVQRLSARITAAEEAHELTKTALESTRLQGKAEIESLEAKATSADKALEMMSSTLEKTQEMAKADLERLKQKFISAKQDFQALTDSFMKTQQRFKIDSEHLIDRIASATTTLQSNTNHRNAMERIASTKIKDMESKVSTLETEKLVAEQNAQHSKSQLMQSTHRSLLRLAQASLPDQQVTITQPMVETYLQLDITVATISESCRLPSPAICWYGTSVESAVQFWMACHLNITSNAGIVTKLLLEKSSSDWQDATPWVLNACEHLLRDADRIKLRVQAEFVWVLGSGIAGAAISVKHRSRSKGPY